MDLCKKGKSVCKIQFSLIYIEKIKWKKNILKSIIFILKFKNFKKNPEDESVRTKVVTMYKRKTTKKHFEIFL